MLFWYLFLAPANHMKLLWPKKDPFILKSYLRKLSVSDSRHPPAPNNVDYIKLKMFGALYLSPHTQRNFFCHILVSREFCLCKLHDLCRGKRCPCMIIVANFKDGSFTKLLMGELELKSSNYSHFIPSETLQLGQSPDVLWNGP